MMAYLRVFLILILLALVACAPVVVSPTATVEPTALPTDVPVTPTVTPTSTPDPNAYFVPVNDGHDLSGFAVMWSEQKGVNNARELSLPPGFSFINTMLIIRDDGDEDCGWLPPYIYNQNTVAGLYRMEPEWLCGTWALEQRNINLMPGRYILKMTYDRIRLKPSTGQMWQNGNIQAFPVLYSSNGNSAHFGRQSIPMTDDGLEQIWVVQIMSPMSLRIQWSWRIEWPSIIGSFILDDLEVLTAPSDFGNDVVVKF